MDKPQKRIESNWLRLFIFFIISILSTLVFFIPVFLTFPDVLKSGENLMRNTWYLVASQLATLCGTVTAFFILKRVIEKENISIQPNFSYFLKGTFISLSIISAVVLIMKILGLVSLNLYGSDKMALQFFLFLIVAINEETICRGYILINLLEKMKPIYAIMISSLIFGLLHTFNDSIGWIGFVNIVLSGALMSILYLKYKNLSVPIGMHFAWNFIQGPVFGFGVSGYNDSGLFLITYHSANDSLTGGNFGIEGSLVLVPILLVSLLVVYVKTENYSMN